MQATARRPSVVSAMSCARRRLIRDVRPRNGVHRPMIDAPGNSRSTSRGIRYLATSGAILIVVAVAWLGYVYHQRSFKLFAESPDHRLQVRGLPFKGVQAHPLDRCLRVYTFGLDGHFEGGAWQTTIPWGTDLRIEWVEPQRFIISRGQLRLMSWTVAGDAASCDLGSDLITYDPHDLWARTGRPTP